jgi:3-deoxy-manno-octulosonate cytidylyltransferase (CMP-KDO synthetase)
MKIIGVIPARYKSSRFEGKPLALINGYPMVWHVYNSAIKSSLLDNVYVATDDDRIFSVCKDLNINCLMTSENNKTGTDRLVEVAKLIDADVYVNIQGDEPLIETETINKAIYPFINGMDVQVTNLMTKIKNTVDVINFTVPKVLVNEKNIGVYLTRSACPYPKGKIDFDFYKQVCVYGFKKEVLLDFGNLKRGRLEQIEDIEILRFIENGYTVQYIEVDSDTIAVDTPNDLQKVLDYINRK